MQTDADRRLLPKLLFILLAGLFIYCIWLGGSPLDRTEPFRALVADRMAHSGSWLVPRLYGEVYLRKPPLIYWIEAIVQKLMGQGDEFVWRLPSAAGSALLAVFVGWWSGRWFGGRAVLPAGFACLALVGLWDQDRGADIDALNTAFAIVTTACVLEILYGLGRSIAGWSLAFGLSLGATLLLKGPGGLPQVFAAVIGPAILLRDWRAARRRWIPLLAGFLMGFAFFAAYAVSAKMQMHRLQIAPDPTGWYEAFSKAILPPWQQRFKALTMPFVLLAYALPVSLVLPFAIDSLRRLSPAELPRQRAVALLGTLAATLLIWLIAGNDNPRYEYVMLPLLAPLVGFAWADDGKPLRWFTDALFAVCILCCLAGLAVITKVPADDPCRKLAVISALTGAGIASACIVGQRWLHRLMPTAAIVMLLLLAPPMSARKNAERRRKSAMTPAAQLRSVIGDAKIVSAAGVVRDMPELFYYANVDVDSYGEFGLPRLVAARGGHWVVISENEKYPAYSTILKFIPGAFPRGITKLNMPDARDKIYVGWYDPPADADTRIEWKVDKAVESED